MLAAVWSSAAQTAGNTAASDRKSAPDPGKGSPGNAGPSAEVIMSAVGANQDRADELRAQYAYAQHIHIATHKPHGKLLREETAEYRVIPAPDSSEKILEQLKGRYLAQGHYIDFTGEPVPDPDSIDGQLIRQFRDDFVNSKSKDGLAKDLFPLTSEEQKELTFRLVGEEMMDGRAAYRIAFQPKEHDELAWAGDAWIDKAEMQPIYVVTRLSRKVPLVVRTMLGTDVPGLGFSVHYRRQEDGLWFPTSFGTEFRFRVLFLLNRDISISLDNRAFERTHVKTRIEMGAPE
jgi:hypothetical protein